MGCVPSENCMHQQGRHRHNRQFLLLLHERYFECNNIVLQRFNLAKGTNMIWWSTRVKKKTNNQKVMHGSGLFTTMTIMNQGTKGQVSIG